MLSAQPYFSAPQVRNRDAPTAPTGADLDPGAPASRGWHLVGFLEKSHSQPIGVGTRFYIADRLEATVIEVVEGEAAVVEGEAAGDKGVQSPGWQQPGNAEEGATSSAAKRPKLQGVAEGSVLPLSAPEAAPSGPASTVIGMHEAPFSLMRVRCAGRYMA